MTPSVDVDALVVGAGIAGLAAARELEARGVSVVVVEAGASPGGVMQTDEVSGYRIERGPNSLLLRAPFVSGLERFGTAGELVKASPASRSRWLLRDGRLVPVPLGPLDLVRTPLLSGRAKRRLLREPFVARGDGRDETVADFVARRLGPELVDGLVGPFLTGVYAGDERELGAEAVFPSLVDAERESGSILVGLLRSARRARRAGERGRPGTWSVRGGLGALPHALAEGLADGVRFGIRVQRIDRDGGALRVELSDGGGEHVWRARRVLVATPGAAAAALVRGLAPEAAAWIESVRYAPVATVGLGAGPDALREPVRGFGFLVPRGEGTGLLGCLFMSELFSDRAPPDRRLLHCILGGTRAPETLDLDDDALVALATRQLDAPLGVVGSLDGLAVRRWPQAVAQPAPGHRAGLRRAREALAAAGPVELAGGYTDGVSVADAFASGVSAADRLAGRVAVSARG